MRSSYRQRIVLNRKEPVYQAVGGHTFFIPTDEGFKVSAVVSSYTLRCIRRTRARTPRIYGRVCVRLSVA